MAAAIIADCSANVFRHAIQIFQQIVNGFGLQLGMALEGLVQVRDVGAMMFVMVNFHRLRVDVGFQSVKCIRQGGHRECHGFVLQCEISLVLCRAACSQ